MNLASVFYYWFLNTVTYLKEKTAALDSLHFFYLLFLVILINTTFSDYIDPIISQNSKHEPGSPLSLCSHDFRRLLSGNFGHH